MEKNQKKMKKSTLLKIEIITYATAGLLCLALVIFLGINDNLKIEDSRKEAGFVEVSDVHRAEVEQSDAPLGVVIEYTFSLDSPLAHDTTLAFYSSHQYVDIYLDGEHMYNMKTSEEIPMIRTVGSTWTTFPLYREDMNKEVRVVLSPVYENFIDQENQFYLGSPLAIYRAQLRDSLPELILSLIVATIGVVYICLSIYFFITKKGGGIFFALGMFATCLGIWRFTDTQFLPFFSESKALLFYYLSLSMLLLIIVPLIKATQKPFFESGNRILRICCVGVASINIFQLLLQWLGILDLRETLVITHGLLAFSAALLVISGITAKRRKMAFYIGNFSWMIAVGIFADLILFYVKGTSNGLILTLFFVLCYVLLEGFKSQIEMNRMLEEKEAQLTQSRITTLMSQIRSHFVFNILNAISGMCKYDPEKADETVVRFARFLRSNINIMEDDNPVPFHMALRHLEDYVVLEQIRFGDKIQFETDITVDHFMLPPLILQPIVENAIKHGLTPKPSGGTIYLRTRETEDAILIIIEDDGIGFDMQELEKSESVGVRNIRFRLQHSMQGKLDIKSEIGKGTKVTISIPKKEAERCE